jgi:hypothetical protein
MGMDMDLIRETSEGRVTIADWRKFRPLHDWIDQHVSSLANAMWEYIPISKEIMCDLLLEINEVLNDHNKVTEYFPSWNNNFNNEYYFECFKYTKFILELCIKDSVGQYFYHAYI